MSKSPLSGRRSSPATPVQHRPSEFAVNKPGQAQSLTRQAKPTESPAPEAGVPAPPDGPPQHKI